MGRAARILCGLAVLGLATGSASGQELPPLPRPLEEIVRHLAEKEVEYARAHAQYAYRLSIRLQELDAEGDVLGEFTEVLEVGLSPTGRRVDRIVEGPVSSLRHLGISRLELFDFAQVPLYSVRPEDLALYRFDYLGTDQIDEVNTFILRASPTSQPRDKVLFEGLLWVDADKLDVVKLFGRTVPTRRPGVLKDYFQRVEVYREPVDDFLFPTFVQGDDVLRVVNDTVRARLVLRFSNHQRVAGAVPSAADEPD